MDKEALIARMDAAVLAHETWLAKAIALIEGIMLMKEDIPLKPTECEFGRWYYGEGQFLRPLVHFREVEPLHDALHATYAEIVAILFEQRQRTTLFFDRFIGHPSGCSERDRDLARQKCKALEQHSRDLIKKMTVLRKFVAGVSLEQLEHYLASYKEAGPQ